MEQRRAAGFPGGPQDHLPGEAPAGGVGSGEMPVIGPRYEQYGTTAHSTPAAPRYGQPAAASPAPYVPHKSLFLAGMLSLFFGPLGMFYSTLSGGLVMMVVTGIVALTTYGTGVPALWPIWVAWAVLAAKAHNDRADLRHGIRRSW